MERWLLDVTAFLLCLASVELMGFKFFGVLVIHEYTMIVICTVVTLLTTYCGVVVGLALIVFV